MTSIAQKIVLDQDTPVQMPIDLLGFADIDALNQVAEHIRRELLDPFVFPGGSDEDDNPPIGIILCTEKDSVTAEYALGGLSNNVFASRYVSYMPDKEQLVSQVEAVI